MKTNPQPKSDELPFYLHINKNGGNTMRAILAANYAASEFFDEFVRGRYSETGLPCTVESPDSKVRTVLTSLVDHEDDWRCAALNLPYGAHRLLSRPLAYFTMLREPIARGISYWYFGYEYQDEHPLWSQIEAYGRDLKRILSERAILQFSNDQIRMITGCNKVEPDIDDLQLACELLQNAYCYVGLVEAFDVGLQKLGRRFGWSRLGYEKQVTTTKADRLALPKNAGSMFRDANEWDLRLYTWACKHELHLREPHPSRQTGTRIRAHTQTYGLLG